MNVNLQGIKIARSATVPFFIATQLSDQIKYLSSKNTQVVIITSKGTELHTLANDHVIIENIEIARSLHPIKDILAIARLFFCFQHYGFKIIHSTTPKAGLLCMIAGTLTRTPIRLHTFTGQPWANLTGIMRFMARFSDRIIAWFSTKCYADSHSQRDYLINEGIIAADKIDVLGKGSLAGVDLRRFDPKRWSDNDKTILRRELGLSKSSRILLFVGRVTKDKGINELLTAFSWLLRNAYDIDLLLVGPIDEERSGSVNISQFQRVHHIGYSSSPEKFMAIADFLCLPSYREGFGTVVIEAAAMELPTVATRIYGLSDAVEDGVTGLLVPPKNSEALASAMKMMLDDPKRSEKMGKDARTRCIKHFNAEKINELQALEYATLVSMNLK